jgi:beta-lactam-binding protein with PASTA domain
MKLIRFLISKTFWANVVLALLVLGGVLWGLNYTLHEYTRHGETIKIPDLTGLALPETEERLGDLGLTYQVIDSSEYAPTHPRGSVINQYPDPGALVKSGRELDLTINPFKPRQIALANLRDKTKRRALYDLKSKGFQVGELQYVPYLGKDVVVDVKVDGASIESGQKFPKGTTVDLVLGQGLGDVKIPVPYLRWLSLAEAKTKLQEKSLNPGSVIYDEGLQDTATALVYRQSPAPTLKPAIRPGLEVDLWLTNDYNKIKADSLQFQRGRVRDSLYADSLSYE